MWMPALMVVQALSWRPGFLHRFALATFAIGLITLPFRQTWSAGVDRLALDSSVGLNNPNDLAAWFGFCAGVLHRRGRRDQAATRADRLMARCTRLGVSGRAHGQPRKASRGRRRGRHRPAPHAQARISYRSCSCLVAAWVSYSVGLFDRIIGFYLERGTVETGRLLVWPLALQRFLASPFAGVGASDIGTYTSISDHPVEPHNGLLHIALASGIVPLMFFVAYWTLAGARAIRASRGPLPEAPFVVPLFAYAFLVMWIGNATFMFAWMIVTLGVALNAGDTRQVARPAAQRARSNRTAAGLVPHYAGRRRSTAAY